MKILILETRKLSYSSSSVFLKEICGILKEYGAEVTHCIIDDPVACSSLLESFTGKHFDAVLDINSILPLAECDDGRYLDCIDAPFINFIVDHPMHVHNYLDVKLKRYYVICIDRHHKEYIGRYYPHIKKTLAMPLGAIKPAGSPGTYSQFKKRGCHILFPATYTPSAYYRQVMEEKKLLYVEQAEEIIRNILAGSTLPVHEMYRQITSWKEESFSGRMYKARFIDKYIRDYLREEVIEAFLAQGFHIDVAGARWEMYSGSNKDRITMHGQYGYADLPGLIAGSKVVLNIQPLFTEAPHDRVFNAMVNGAAVLTDSCTYIEENRDYINNMLIYDKTSIQESIEGLADMLNNTRRLYEMACRLHYLAAGETWNDRCKKIIQFIREIS